MNLHLGCFDQIAEGWVNTDVTPHIVIARVPGAAWLLHKIGKMDAHRFRQHKEKIFQNIKYVNVSKKFPFRSDSFDNVYCSHLLEHLYRSSALSCVREVYRVLKTGGIFRVSVPDLDRAVARFASDAPEEFLKLMYESEQQRDKNSHHWMYNATEMTRLLKAAGFSNVYSCNYREGRCADAHLLDNRPEESLFMEAVK